MEKVTRYRQIIQHLLETYSEQKPAYANIEVEKIFDKSPCSLLPSPLPLPVISGSECGNCVL
jgi:hypothetical protein